MTDLTPAEREAIEARDAEVDTSALWRNWENQHPVIAQLIIDRRRLLAALRVAETERDQARADRHGLSVLLDYEQAEARALPSVDRLAVALNRHLLVAHGSDGSRPHQCNELCAADLVRLAEGSEP